MRKVVSVLAALLLFGCVVSSPISRSCVVVLTPKVVSSAQTQTVTPLFTEASIARLGVRLYTLDQSGVEHSTGIERTLLNAQLANPIVFSNLKANTIYRIKAFAYDSGDALISTDDTGSFSDVPVTTGDRPVFGVLRVKLIDRAFLAIASSSLQINQGGYDPIGIAAMEIPMVGLVSTLAGNGSGGYLDGVGMGAQLYAPHDLDTDSSGNIYVADDANHRIRKISPAGVVTTLAGSGALSYLDGSGTAASFRRPISVALDAQSNVYVADFENNRIRKITPAGVVTTVAGSGSAASVDGVGTLASFAHPVSLRFDTNGNLYVLDYSSHSIRKMDLGGNVTTFAGSGSAGFMDGQGTYAGFAEPCGLTVDAQNNLYIADRANHAIRKVTPGGLVSTLAGNGGSGYVDGLGTQAFFFRPDAIAIDSKGFLYIADSSNNVIRKITPGGLVTTLAGSGSAGNQNGKGAVASFSTPSGVAVGPYNTLYVTDIGNNCVRKVQ